MSEKDLNLSAESILPATLSAFLTRPSLFSVLNESEFNVIQSFLKVLDLKEGESIFREGDAGEDMFVLLSGSLSAYCAQSDGTQRKLFDIKPGDFLGEMSVIAHEPRSATIIASVDSTLIMLKGIDFFCIIKKHPTIGFKMLRAISVVENQWLDQSSKAYNDLIRWGEAARHRAITDEMTGLYNRRFLEESIKRRFKHQPLHLRIMSLLMMDLDRIHAINEKYGSRAGDLIITSAAEIIRICVRSGDIAARLSGDEFAILLPDTDKNNAARVAERIREKIEKKQVMIPVSPTADESILISTCTSIGISTAPVNAKTAEELINTSDSALRRAKEMGRNRVEVYG